MWSTQALTALGGPKLYNGRPNRTVSAFLISSTSATLSANDVVLRRRVLVDGQQSGRPCHAVEVRNRVHGEVAVVDRAAGMRRAPALGRTGGQTPADGAVALHGRVDVKQVRHL